MKVPFVDLAAQYHSIKNEIDSAIENVIANTAFIGGKPVKEFEDAYSKYIGVKHVIACGNGTDSIEILLKTMGVGTGDEVIVPAISWISTSEAVSSVGATPVFVDVHPQYYTIDESLIEAAITPNTKAIIPVHLYGQPANMPAIMGIAAKHNLKVIEDCAQSHIAAVDGKLIGTIGHAASFSFYPGKNLGAYGDAGCMVTNDDSIAEVVRMIANHGQKGKHNHQMEGRNSRLDGLQAAILSAKLPHLNDWTDARAKVASWYDELLADSGVVAPAKRPNGKHVYHLYVIQTDNREEVAAMLKENGIETAVHYPTALPFLPCYSAMKHTAEDFPVAHSMQSRILSLPMYPELSKEQVAYVAGCLSEKTVSI